jgi:hypothetical protein
VSVTVEELQWQRIRKLEEQVAKLEQLVPPADEQLAHVAAHKEIESDVKAYDEKHAALWTGHENILRNLSDRVVDLEKVYRDGELIDTLREKIATLERAVTQLQDRVDLAERLT